MHEIRVDPLTGLRAIIAEGRGDRPGAGWSVPAPASPDEASDPLLEGHEERTPPELAAFGAPPGRAPDTPGW